MATDKPKFEKETDLCAAFLSVLPKEWVAYPETAGWDILLVRPSDGFQVGVQAKLKLNAKVLLQAAEELRGYTANQAGPDVRAVLIPSGVSMDLAGLLPHLGLVCFTVTAGDSEARWSHNRAAHVFPYLPRDPKDHYGEEWIEHAPSKRHQLPDYVPDVRAGASAPASLTPWKIGAIKIVVTLRKRGFLTRDDFAHFRVSMSRWTQQSWLIKGPGGWVAGEYLPNFKAQHPRNFLEIEADYEKWKSPAPAQQALL